MRPDETTETIDTTGPEVVTLGECLISLVAADATPLADARTFQPYVVGAEANVAVGLARLGHRVAFIGRVGADGFGRRVLRALRGEGVDTVSLTVHQGAPTGLMIRERRGIGPSEAIYHRAGSAGGHLGPEDVAAAVERGAFAGARWLHLTGITPALSASCRAAVAVALAAARGGGLTVSLDVNLRRLLWSDAESAVVLRELATQVDLLFADETEAALVTGLDVTAGAEVLARAAVALGPSLAVIKLGADGGLVVEGNGPAVRGAGLRVARVVDPVGAGDAFSAGFIAARLDGSDVPTALAWANACGAATVSVEGDMTGLPTRPELGRLLAGDAPDTLR